MTLDCSNEIRIWQVSAQPSKRLCRLVHKLKETCKSISLHPTGICVHVYVGLGDEDRLNRGDVKGTADALGIEHSFPCLSLSHTHIYSRHRVSSRAGWRQLHPNSAGFVEHSAPPPPSSSRWTPQRSLLFVWRAFDRSGSRQQDLCH